MSAPKLASAAVFILGFLVFVTAFYHLSFSSNGNDLLRGMVFVQATKSINEPLVIDNNAHQSGGDGDGNGDVQLNQAWLDQDESLRITSFAVLTGDPSRVFPLESAVEAFKRFGLVRTDSSVVASPSVVLVSSLDVLANYSSLNGQEPQVSLIDSPCLQAHVSGRISCLEQYRRSRGSCSWDQIAFTSYRLDMEHECIRVLMRKSEVDGGSSSIANKTELAGVRFYFFSGKVGDGGEGSLLPSGFDNRRFPGLATKGSPAVDPSINPQTIESFCRRPRPAGDVVQIRPLMSSKTPMTTVTVNILIASTTPLVAFAQLLPDSPQSKRILRIARFVVRAIAFSVHQQPAGDLNSMTTVTVGSANQFQAFAIRVGWSKDDNDGDSARLISIKSSPKLGLESWMAFLHRVNETKIWGEFPSSLGKELPQRPDLKVHTLVDDRLPINDDDVCGDPREPREIKPIVQHLNTVCPRYNQIPFGSSVSCSDLQLHPDTSPVSSSLMPRSSKRLFTYLEAQRVCGASEMITLGGFARAQAMGIKALPRKCSGYVSFSQAKRFCESAGMRLCTVDELVTLQLTANTGCEGDLRRVWSITQCNTSSDDGRSYMTAPGERLQSLEGNPIDADSANRLFPIRCVNGDDRPLHTSRHRGFVPPAIARCCADETPPICLDRHHPKLFYASSHRTLNDDDDGCNVQAGSELTCLELRFKLLPSTQQSSSVKKIPHRVCAQIVEPDSASGFPDPEICRQGLRTFAEARETCFKMGARMCTAAEVMSSGTSSNPLSLRACSWKAPGAGAWVADACADPAQARLVNPLPVQRGGIKARCVDPDKATLAIVACCGDEFGRYCAAG